MLKGMVETALVTLMTVEGIAGFGFTLSHGMVRVSNFEATDKFIGSNSQKLYDDLTGKLLHAAGVPCVNLIGQVEIKGEELVIQYSPTK